MSTREELARQAEKSLRQGRVDEAIAQYQELAYLAPVDWGLVKQLADLLERTGQREGAARQFARWADHLFAEGFHSKAAALYKKVLKLEDNDEHALWQLGEVSVALKLRADARVAFQRVADLRHRRGDASGASAARERLATLEATPAVPTSTPATPPAYAYARAAVTPPLVAADAMPPSALPTAPAPAAAWTDRPATPDPPPPEPVSGAPPETIVAAAPAAASAPPETPEARLARLRREAEDADARKADDADARWQALLDADPAAVAVRIRLVRAAIDRRDLELAAQLAEPLDAAEVPALVVRVDLAHRRGRPDEVDRLIAGRVHAGALPEHVLAPVHLLSASHPAAARAALAAAVGAWTATGQPGHAVAAIEEADGRGLLSTAMYLEWVEICVDAGLPGLSRAQCALARAYLAELRVAEARAVAEDVFVRESGAEPSRALLLDVLERQRVADPERVLADLLTPPSDAITDGDDSEADPLATESAWLPAAPGESAAAVEDVASYVVPDPEPGAARPVVEPVAEHALAEASPAAAGANFDWSDLLGREVDLATGPPAGPSQVPVMEASTPPRPTPEPTVLAVQDAVDVSAAVPVVEVSPDMQVVPVAAVPDQPVESPIPSAGELSPSADGAARIGDLRAQPLLSADVPLQPSFAMPRGWLGETAASSSADGPRHRAPEDDFFFDDDATPPRWAPPALRHQALTPTPPPAPVTVQAPERVPSEVAPEPVLPPVDAAVADASIPDAPDISTANLEVLPGSRESAATVEEEVDLTQLLEELKQWDPVLPEPRARTRSASTDEPLAGLPLDFPTPVAAGDESAAELPVERPVETARTAEDSAPDDVLLDPPAAHGAGSAELDAVFADMQHRTDDRAVAEQQLAAGRVFLAAGLASEAARAFERASVEPRSRFEGTLALAELHKSRGQLLEAVTWYEQAAAAPVPDAAVKRAVLYDLAESLEALGETDRALGVLLDLLSQVEDYRDARARLDRLLRVDAGG